jgi:HSP20 family protein
MALVPVKRTDMGNLMRLPQRMSSDLLNQIMGQWEPFMGERALWPAIDIADKADAIVIKAEVPGCKAEDIEISIYGSTMTISGEKKEHAEVQKENYYHVESRFGSFRRDLILPAEVDVDKVSAQYKDGILTVTMPKAEKAKAKRIKVQG